jgi:cytochrome c
MTLRSARRGLIASAVLSVSVAAAGAGRAAKPADAAVARGAQIAQRCAACHAVGVAGPSRNNGAPPFRALRLRYNPLGLEQALQRVARFGHYEMRPQQLSDADADDLAAYIATLQRPPAK